MLNPHRFAHVEQEHIPTLGERRRLQHQRGRLWDGHEVTNDLRVGDGDQSTGSDLAAEQWHHRT